jgi:rhamnogalacturonyl hydrolase YesR
MTWAALYSPSAHLLHRDSGFVTSARREGQPRFWGRGNAWAAAGLARMLAGLPSDHAARPRWMRRYHELLESLLAQRTSDGLLPASLGGPPSSATGETSASSLLVFAIAHGLHHGLLEANRWEPPLRELWWRLRPAADIEGTLSAVQGPSDQPGPSRNCSPHGFAAGAFLLAGTEVLALQGGDRSRGSAGAGGLR